MANVTAPASLSFSGGELRCSRIVSARLRYTKGDVVTSRDTPLTTLADIPVLDRLQRFDRLVQGEGVAPRFQYIWQQTMEAIEDAFVAVNARVDEVAILARISAVEQLAEVANDNAVAAKATADTVKVATRDTFDVVSPGAGDTFNDTLGPNEQIP